MSDAVDRGFTVTEVTPVGEPLDPIGETTAAFVGRTLRGPVNDPVLISGYAEFTRRFGADWKLSELGPAVEQFFAHGGGRAWVVRVANKARGALLCLPASGSALVLRALEPGSTERIRAAVDYDGVREDESRFNLTIQRIDPRTGLVRDQEIFRRASIVKGSEGFVVDSLLNSAIVCVESPLPTHRPEATSSIDAVTTSPYVGHAQDGSDGAELTDYDIIGSRRHGTGLFTLDAVPHFDILYIPPPGQAGDLRPTSILAADRYCRERAAMLIVDPLVAWQSAAAATEGVRDLGYSSPNMLAYFPRMRRRDDPAGSARVVGGAIAGLLCRLDRTAGPWRRLDEAGIGFRRVYVPAANLDDDSALALRRAGINCIRSGRAGSALLVGSVTLGRRCESRRDYASLHVRRLLLRIIAAIDRATRQAAFRGNGRRLAQGIEDQVSVILETLAAMRAIGERQRVHCDVRGAQRATAANDISIHVIVEPAGCESPVSLVVHQDAAGRRLATSGVETVRT